MRTKILFSGILLLSGLAPAMAADPTGDWRVGNGAAHIRIAQCGSSMWGVVAWEKEPGGKDVNNPDVSKKNRPMLGMPILIDMKKKPDADQWEGQVYNAKDGQLYSSTITPTDAEHLEIRGCVLGFLCGGETWTRVGPPIPSHAAGMAKEMQKGSGAPKHVSTAAAPSARTTGSAGKPADPVGDICLLPDVAGFAH